MELADETNLIDDHAEFYCLSRTVRFAKRGKFNQEFFSFFLQGKNWLWERASSKQIFSLFANGLIQIHMCMKSEEV